MAGKNERNLLGFILFKGIQNLRSARNIWIFRLASCFINTPWGIVDYVQKMKRLTTGKGLKYNSMPSFTDLCAGIETSFLSNLSVLLMESVLNFRLPNFHAERNKEGIDPLWQWWFPVRAAVETRGVRFGEGPVA